MSHLRPALVMLVLMSLLTGVVYPLLVTGVAQALFPAQARGGLIERHGKIVGAGPIAQAFVSDRYFHPRPSAAGAGGYDGAASSGSNYGPTSKALVERVKAAVESNGAGGPVPLDLVTASGSGLDPHVSPAAARFQVARVARTRRVDPATVQALVATHTEGRQFGLLGEPRVNVLRLNLALDDAFGPPP